MHNPFPAMVLGEDDCEFVHTKDTCEQYLESSVVAGLVGVIGTCCCVCTCAGCGGKYSPKQVFG